jgi:hypothetical protein
MSYVTKTVEACDLEIGDVIVLPGNCGTAKVTDSVADGPAFWALTAVTHGREEEGFYMPSNARLTVQARRGGGRYNGELS